MGVVVIIISLVTFPNSIPTRTGKLDNAPPGQVNPYYAFVLPTLRPTELRGDIAEGCVPRVDMVQNHWPFLFTTPVYFFDCQICIHFQANRF